MKSYIYKKSAILLFAFAAVFAAYTNGISQTVDNQTQTVAKNESVVRIGLPTVKTGAVGEGISAQELAAAIQNSLGEYLKGTKVELVPLDAKLASTIETEAREKQCDFVLYAQISHKKGGGGGFGKMFSQIAPMMTSVVPGAGGMGGAIAGSVVSTAVTTAATASANVKPKDELTLDIKLQNGAAIALAKQYKAKAKSDGEDIISPMIEQAAQAILDAAAK